MSAQQPCRRRDFFVGAISQRGATVSAAIRLFFSPTRHLTGFGGIALLPHRSNNRAESCG